MAGGLRSPQEKGLSRPTSVKAFLDYYSAFSAQAIAYEKAFRRLYSQLTGKKKINLVNFFVSAHTDARQGFRCCVCLYSV